MKAIEMAREADSILVKAEMIQYYDGAYADSGTARNQLHSFAELVRADEREACAKVCETKGAIKYAGLTIGEQCAAAIRTRGDK